MKLTELLTSSTRVGLHVVLTDESTLCDLGWQIADGPPEPAVRTIRGRKSRTRAALFDELAAAMQFPFYFGENWDALDEVIADLSWLPGEAFLLLFSGADLLLADAAESDVALLFAALSGAYDEWQKEGVAFHAVFQGATADAVTAVSSCLEKAGQAFDRIEMG